MNSQDEFKDLIRFSGFKEAALLAELLKYGKLTFKLTRIPHALGSLLPSSQAIVIQVLNEDFKRAKDLLSEYRKAEGVPFS